MKTEEVATIKSELILLEKQMLKVADLMSDLFIPMAQLRSADLVLAATLVRSWREALTIHED